MYTAASVRVLGRRVNRSQMTLRRRRRGKPQIRPDPKIIFLVLVVIIISVVMVALLLAQLLLLQTSRVFRFRLARA